jgi:hypothetical protein
MIKAARTAMVIILGLVSTASVLIILAPDEENGEFIIIGKTYALPNANSNNEASYTKDIIIPLVALIIAVLAII